jgi:RNA polymerase sigma-70 factor (ECF subfamily)
MSKHWSSVLQAHDETRFIRLYEAHLERVYAYFKRRTDTTSAQECTADTFLVAWRRLDVVPEDKELQWLYGVARRVIANRRRSARRAGRLARKLITIGDDPSPAAEAIVVRRQEDEELLAAVSRLRPQDRELLMLATWEELPHTEIAQMLGCSRHAVDQRLHRATTRLARELARPGHRAIDRSAAGPAGGATR